MRIPLSKRLRKQEHREIASLQDEVVEIMFSAFADCKPVLHGGTAVWRCYDGNRFSEDLDFYALEREDFKERLLKEAKALGLSVAKFKQTENVVFAKISDGGVEVRLEINFARVRTEEAVVGRFEKTDGSFLDVLILPPEALISEKMLAYENRRFVRDFYDVYHLSGLIEGQVRGLKEFLSRAKPPVDEKNLETLVYSGVAPSFKRMTEVLTARTGKTS